VRSSRLLSYTVDPGCHIVVRFAPQTPGAKTAIVHITSGAEPIDIGLMGTATP